LRDQERKPDADREAAGIERDAARALLRRQPVGQRLQARHVGAGKADAGERPERGRRPEALCEQPEGRGRKAAQHGATDQHAARVDAVGQRREHRNGEHVAERIGAGHQPGLRGSEPPQRDEMARHDRRHDDVRQQVADLSGAHRGDERAAGEVHVRARRVGKACRRGCGDKRAHRNRITSRAFKDGRHGALRLCPPYVIFFARNSIERAQASRALSAW
jgi:hypothetical protein